MISYPEVKTRNGLISQYHLTGQPYASSTNLNDNRIYNPITPSSGDRWCSGATKKLTSETLGVVLNSYVYITNYTLVNQDDYASPISWKFEGYSNKKGWELLSTIKNSNIGRGQYGTFPTEKSGPYKHFRFVSIQNGYDYTFYNYHFCIYKIDFFGIAFSKKEQVSCCYKKHICHMCFCFLLI